MIVKHKFVGLNTKSTEVFGDLGNSGFSKTWFYQNFIE